MDPFTAKARGDCSRILAFSGLLRTGPQFSENGRATSRLLSGLLGASGGRSELATGL